MFLGEWSCMFVFMAVRYYNRKKGIPMELGPQTFSPFVFLPAALCDMTATSLMYVGLNLTFASSFQMLRGMCFWRWTFVSDVEKHTIYFIYIVCWSVTAIERVV